MVIVAMFVLGCQFAFGTYSGTGGSAAATGGATATGGTGIAGSTSVGCSINGLFSCEGDQLSRCDGVQWVSKICEVGTTCDQQLGQCDVCASDYVNCETGTDGGAVLTTCNASLLTYDKKTCTGSTPLCDENLGACVVCHPNQSKQCEMDAGVSTGSFRLCNGEGTGWGATAICPAKLGCKHVDGVNDFCIDCLQNQPAACSVVSKTIKTCTIDGTLTSIFCDAGCSENSVSCN